MLTLTRVIPLFASPMTDVLLLPSFLLGEASQDVFCFIDWSFQIILTPIYSSKDRYSPIKPEASSAELNWVIFFMIICSSESVGNIVENLNLRIKQSFSLDSLLAMFTLDVTSHVAKKNGRPIYKAGSRPFLGKSPELRFAEQRMVQDFNRLYKGEILNKRLWVIMHFYFPKEVYFTQKGEISKKLPDLSNLYELPQDCLIKARVIADDTLIDSHDLSRRLVGDSYKLEIFILEYKDKWPNGHV